MDNYTSNQATAQVPFSGGIFEAPVEPIFMADTDILSARLAAAEEALLKMDERVDALVEEKVSGRLAGHQEAMGALQEAHNGTGERISAVEAQILSCLERIEASAQASEQAEEAQTALLEVIASEESETPEEEEVVADLAASVEEVPVEEPEEPAAQELSLWERCLGATGRAR